MELSASALVHIVLPTEDTQHHVSVAPVDALAKKTETTALVSVS